MTAREAALRRALSLLARGWRTSSELAEALGMTTAGATARARDLRKPEYGAHAVECRFIGGVWRYRIAPREERVPLPPIARGAAEEARAGLLSSGRKRMKGSTTSPSLFSKGAGVSSDALENNGDARESGARSATGSGRSSRDGDAQ